MPLDFIICMRLLTLLSFTFMNISISSRASLFAASVVMLFSESILSYTNDITSV